jgi:hypothetical protein
LSPVRPTDPFLILSDSRQIVRLPSLLNLLLSRQIVRIIPKIVDQVVVLWLISYIYACVTTMSYGGMFKYVPTRAIVDKVPTTQGVSTLANDTRRQR